MASPEPEDAPSPGSLFDSSPEPGQEIDTMPTRTCGCGYSTERKDNLDGHKLSCSQRVATSAVNNMLRQEDSVQEQPSFTNSYESPILDLEPRFHMPPNTPHSPKLPSPRATRPPPDYRTLQELPDQAFQVRANLQPASTSTPQHYNDSDLFRDYFTPRHPQSQPHLGATAESDPYLNLHAQNRGSASQRHGIDSSPVTNPFPLAHPTMPQPQPRPSPPSRSASALNFTTTALQRVGSFFKGRGKSKNKGPKRDNSPSNIPANAVSKRRKVDAEKQRKCRQRKADNQEALEAEVQRLRAILENLGGCGEGVEIEERNWH